MIYSFPFDSEITGTDPETGLPILDRAQYAWQLQAYLEKMFSSGILPNIHNCFKCEPLDSERLSVGAGSAMVGGCIAISTERTILQIPEPDFTYDRIDAVVLRRDNAVTRRADLEIVEGTPAPSPKPPTLHRDAMTSSVGVYEICLCHILTKRDRIGLSQADIKDTRYDAELCGVSSPYSEVDTTGIFNQYQAAFDGWFSHVKGQLSTDAAGNLQNQINVVANETKKIETAIDTSKRIERFDYKDAALVDGMHFLLRNGTCEVSINGNFYLTRDLHPGQPFLLTVVGKEKFRPIDPVRVGTELIYKDGTRYPVIIDFSKPEVKMSVPTTEYIRQGYYGIEFHTTYLAPLPGYGLPPESVNE